MKRLTLWILILACLASAGLLPAGAEGESYVLAGYDPTQYRVWSENAFFASMEEMTGVHFELKQYTSLSSWEEAKASFTAGADMPDVLFKAQLTGYECAEMLDKGVLVDLKPYLETCCPHLWAMIREDDAILSAITLPDGRIAALPYISETPTQNVMWINKKFLARTGKDAPTTWDELTDVLRAFRDTDANGNGDPNDEIPMGFLGPYDLKYLGHAFGLICNDYNLFVTDSGEVRYMPAEERFMQLMTGLREWYREGLLDPAGFTSSDVLRRVTDANKPQRCGVIFAPMITTLFPSEWLEDYVCLMPLRWEGEARYRDVGLHVVRGTFAVTTHCRNVGEVLSWADLMYADEGSVLASVGKKNTDYVIDGDGSWRLTESAKGDSYYTVSHTITSGAEIPGFSAEEFHAKFNDPGLKTMLEALHTFNEKCVLPFPYLYLTREENTRIAALQGNLGYIVDMQIARWVLGEEEITAESGKNFVSALKEAGLDEFLALWQGIYDAQEGR